MSKRWIKLLTAAGVPQEHHAQAVANFRSARIRALARLPIGLCASVFWLTMGWAVPRKAERLPWLLRWADNNISINGDRLDWAMRDDGTYYRLPSPDHDVVHPDGTHKSYWPPYSPRSYLPRLNFNGWRNRAGYMGIVWGRDLGAWDMSRGYDDIWLAPELKLTVLRYGDIFEMRCQRASWGFEIHNCNAIDRIATPTYQPFIYGS